jgi:hypothetical protein
MPEYNYRLAVDEHGNHGYEVGYWKADSDQKDPLNYIVEARVYDQLEAQLKAASLAANPPDHLPPDESGEGGAAQHEDEEPHKRGTVHHTARHRK